MIKRRNRTFALGSWCPVIPLQGKKRKTAEKSCYMDTKNKIETLCECCWGAKKGSENSPAIPDNNPKPDPGWKYCSVCLACSQRWDHTKKPHKCASCKNKDIKIYDVYGQEKLSPKKITIPSKVWIGGCILLIIIFILLFLSHQKVKKNY